MHAGVAACSHLMSYLHPICFHSQAAHADLAGLRMEHGVLASRMRCIEGSEDACR